MVNNGNSDWLTYGLTDEKAEKGGQNWNENYWGEGEEGHGIKNVKCGWEEEGGREKDKKVNR